MGQSQIGDLPARLKEEAILRYDNPVDLFTAHFGERQHQVVTPSIRPPGNGFSPHVATDGPNTQFGDSLEIGSPLIGGTMAATLVEKTCTPCRGGVPPLTAEEAEGLRLQAPEWALMDDARRLERMFRFRNFREALTFVQQVGDLAETEGHHPDISFGWGYATVSLRTKKIKGLHENDFIMATKIDRMAQGGHG